MYFAHPFGIVSEKDIVGHLADSNESQCIDPVPGSSGITPGFQFECIPLREPSLSRVRERLHPDVLKWNLIPERE